ncbi:MAG: D-alanine--D-alanine ligase family protein [Patescibacteria group bacterium]
MTIGPGRYGKLRVGVIVGGTPEELNDAIYTTHEVSKTLEDLGYHVEIITFDERFEKVVKYARLDMAFIIDSTYIGERKVRYGLRDLLEKLKIPYTGSGSKAASITKNKVLSKKYFEMGGLLTPYHLEINRKNLLRLKERLAKHNMEPPYVIKPRDEGAGMGVYFVDTPRELLKIAKKLLKRHQNLIVEQYIRGIEVTVPILEIKGKATPLASIEMEKAKNVKVLSYDVKSILQFSPQKEIKRVVAYHVPARINKALSKKVLRSATIAHKIIGCKGYSRVDAIIDRAKNVYILEINSLPILSESGHFTKAAEFKGLNYKDIINHIVHSVLD